jgi:hypothetical protein
MLSLQEGLAQKPALDSAHRLRSELGLLRRELLQAKALLQAAASYYQAIGAILGCTPEIAEIDYRSGRPRPLRSVGPKQVVVHG